MIRFENREEAGKLLANKLQNYKNSDCIVMAIPKGGVPVAFEIAMALNKPLELVLTKKIGHPENKEFAIGAASLSDYFIMPEFTISNQYKEVTLASIRSRLKEMFDLYMGLRKPLSITDKTILLTDDGIATGNTLLSTLQLIRKQNPAKIIITVPVASRKSLEHLSKKADEIICLQTPAEFHSVGEFYDDFRQVTDEDVLQYLKNAKTKEPHV